MKYILRCTKCGKVYNSFKEWFDDNQKCSACGCARAEAEYFSDYTHLLDGKENNFLERYFDFIPLYDRKNVVSDSEGVVPIEEWEFLEEFARENYGINLKAFVCRNDLNGGTGTFKDPGGALGASLLKEHGVKKYCLASTGNTATAFAHYCAKVGVDYTVFAPNDVCPDTVKAIKAEGQRIVISEGNYADAKKEAADYASENKVLISTGNTDPIRVESKRTIVFEFLRKFGGKLPDVYFQAVAGGTCPIAIDKAVRELLSHGYDVKYPKMMLVQQDKCDPMVQAWEKAVKEGFPEGYETDFPKLEPHTKVAILSSGIPGMYPILAPIVRKSNGSFVRVEEDELPLIGKWVKNNTGLVLGPASIVCITGFIQALREGKLSNGQTVVLNYGESCCRNKAFAELINKPLK